MLNLLIKSILSYFDYKNCLSTVNIEEELLSPIGHYYGEFTPQNLVFNANLPMFAQQVSYLCNLENNGKISPNDTYEEIKNLWQQLKHSKQELLDNTNFTNEE